MPVSSLKSQFFFKWQFGSSENFLFSRRNNYKIYAHRSIQFIPSTTEGTSKVRSKISNGIEISIFFFCDSFPPPLSFFKMKFCEKGSRHHFDTVHIFFNSPVKTLKKREKIENHYKAPFLFGIIP